MHDLALASEFPDASRADWLAAVEGVLKGASFDEILRSPTAEGFRVEPLYERARDRGPLPGRAPGERWTIVQRVDHPDPIEANRLALADLEGGADGLSLVFAGSDAAAGHGLSTETLDALERALDGVILDILSIRIDAGRRSRAAAALVMALLARHGLDPSRCRVAIGYDPAGVLASRGRLSAPWSGIEARIADLAIGLGSVGHHGPALALDGRIWHAAGASRSLTIAALAASAAAYLRALDKAGLAPDVALGRMEAIIAADTDAFLTIASVRALRLVFARLAEACGVDAPPIMIHAESARTDLAAQDVWTNMLRGAIAAFAAGVGGANSVTVLPFTTPLGLPDAFARRVARNAQHVLMAESNLHRLADPAAGSGALEGLTDALAETAWRHFQAIEAQGGIAVALENGFLRGRIADARAARPAMVRVGVTKFLNPDERPVAVLDAARPALSPRTRAPITAPVGDGGNFAAMMAAAGEGASLADLSPTSQGGALRAVPIMEGGAA